MKAVILAGGLGTRISEETATRPKPMIEIGGQPILWHIMKIYTSAGIRDFIICCGYKNYVIKEYFANFLIHQSDVTIDLTTNEIEVHKKHNEPWRVTLIDTGEHSMTGGRLKRVKDYLRNEEAFCFTYGDGVADINIAELIEFHKTHGKLATITAVQPPGRYGAIRLGENFTNVAEFVEKPYGEAGWINGGFFVLSPEVIDLIPGDDEPWERYPMSELARRGHMEAFFHEGFWQPMDTLREKKMLEELWASGKAPWKVWA